MSATQTPLAVFEKLGRRHHPESGKVYEFTLANILRDDERLGQFLGLEIEERITLSNLPPPVVSELPLGIQSQIRDYILSEATSLAV